MTQEEKQKGEVYCYGCGNHIPDVDKCFIDLWFLDWFGVVFCSEQCRDNYINSK